MAISQGLLLWLLINIENGVKFPQNIWRRSLENLSEACPNQMNRELNSFLWFMDRSPPVYFFGTIHVPYTKVWDHIPTNSKRAFKTANNVYFELDLTDQEKMKTLERCKSLPNGVKLRDVLPTTLHKRIKAHLSYILRKLPEWITMEQKIMGLRPVRLYRRLTRNWHKKRPIWIMLLLDKLTEYNVKLLAQGLPVLDRYLMHEAILNEKTVGFIENVEEQCEVLNKLNNSQVILALNQTMTMHEKIRRGEEKMPFSVKQLIYHYNCGDLKDVLFSEDISSITSLENMTKSNSVQKEQAKRFEEDMKEELFFKRNRKMANKIVSIVEDEPKKSMIFALGAGHFLGNKSIIDILRSRGYNIIHLKAGDPLPRYGPSRTGKLCKKRKPGKRRRRSKNGKRRRHRVEKYCDNDIKKLVTNKTRPTACKPCTTQDPPGFIDAWSASTSINVSHLQWIVIFVLLVFFNNP